MDAFIRSTISSRYGSVSNSHAVEVGEGVKLLEHPVNTSLFFGQNVVFLCVATGEEPISYSWRHNGNTFSEANSLVLHDVSAQMSGEYVLFVSNKFSSERVAFTVDVVEPTEPPAPAEIEIVMIPAIRILGENRSYSLEFKENLEDEWTVLSETINLTTNSFLFPDLSATNAQRRVYRAIGY